jgi:prephenate dehydratase
MTPSPEAVSSFSTDDTAAADIAVVHTLGPAGTNLEMAACQWMKSKLKAVDVRLHPTLEIALPQIPDDGRHALLACAVYPELHSLVFSSLQRMRMIDAFILPTYNMVLASKGTTDPQVVASHPAPAGLVSAAATVRVSTSNSKAAQECADGQVDGCITTAPAAAMNGLQIIRDFGPVPMVFTVHHISALQEAVAA